MINILNQKTDLADAYFADNDIIAAAAMKAFRENGIRIPEDISIIGFDDMPLCDMMVPSLSTMRVKKKELGATAVQRLMDRVSDNHRESLKMSMSTKLIKRDSVSKLTR
jgi:LacI family transcriptional regulator